MSCELDYIRNEISLKRCALFTGFIRYDADNFSIVTFRSNAWSVRIVRIMLKWRLQIFRSKWTFSRWVIEWAIEKFQKCFRCFIVYKWHRYDFHYCCLYLWIYNSIAKRKSKSKAWFYKWLTKYSLIHITHNFMWDLFKALHGEECGTHNGIQALAK